MSSEILREVLGANKESLRVARELRDFKEIEDRGTSKMCAAIWEMLEISMPSALLISSLKVEVPLFWWEDPSIRVDADFLWRTKEFRELGFGVRRCTIIKCSAWADIEAWVEETVGYLNGFCGVVE